jgi:hypothetical protein
MIEPIPSDRLTTFAPDGRWNAIIDASGKKGEHQLEIHRGPIDEPPPAIEE